VVRLDFVPNTKKQQEEMLQAIGVKSIDELFADIPQKIRLRKELALSGGLSEQEVKQHLVELSKKNANASEYSYFIGAGAYNHFIPAAVWALAGRSEFVTAYTPYQPEISQGMLQSIFEWQTVVCMLTGMDAANASTYDAAEATAEAVLMSKNLSRRTKVFVSEALNPQFKDVARTYANANHIEFVEVKTENGITSLKDLQKKLDENTAGFIVQNPNFFGCIEDLKEIGEAVRANGSVFTVCVSELVSLGLLKPPGELGADIVVGDAQSFGIPISFGGPYAGFVATKFSNVRELPGRIVGQTVDGKGRNGYIMTLQAREQHIRREKAHSNLCTNQALFALAATINIVLLGKKGVMQLAEQNAKLAHYAAEKISKLKGFEVEFKSPFFNEFVVKCGNAGEVQAGLLKKKIIGGYLLENDFPNLKNRLLFCVTEMNSREQIDELLGALK